MPIQLKLFGDLRKRVKFQISDAFPLKLSIDDSDVKRVSDIIKKYNIEEDEVSHIFVDGQFAGFSKIVNNGDIVALFPRNMGLLYKWYFKRDEDE